MIKKSFTWAIIYLLALVAFIIGLGIILYNPSSLGIVFVCSSFLLMLLSLTKASITA